MQAFQDHQRANSVAWNAAKLRLVGMCPATPGCRVRMEKLTNGPRTDDWVPATLPPYTTVVRIHEEELRTAGPRLVYEEYALAVSRALAARADAGEITDQMLVDAFNKAWTYLVLQMRDEARYRMQAIQLAQLQDASTQQALSSLALGVSAAAEVALTVRAFAPPRPFTCTSVQTGITVTAQCF